MEGSGIIFLMHLKQQKKLEPSHSRFQPLKEKARDGTRTRGPDLGKVVLHH